ncbi:MAG: transposase [Deltaproteobacteria bacterium]|nr:transposase [Deltaproteobacteria bacterium]
MKSTYTRHGHLDMFVALEIQSGIAHTKTYPRKRRIEFLDFMNYLVETIPSIKDGKFQLHIVMENYCIHKNCDVWFVSHPNVFFHYTPTSASWLNLAEVYLGKFTRPFLNGASFSTLDEVDQAVADYRDYHNNDPKPYRWRKREVKGTQLRNILSNFVD